MTPDSVTIYQMEIPYNTTIFKEMKVMGQSVAPVADWRTKREWVDYAFAELEKAGYTVSSAYTAVKDPARTKFLYRDLLWTGADMIGLGVASFSHVGGTHFQNEHEFETAMSPSCSQGKLPIYRALTTDRRRAHDSRADSANEARPRAPGILPEANSASTFRSDSPRPLSKLQEQGYLIRMQDSLRLNRDGLLQVDRLLYEFFLPEHRNARYA